MASVAVNQLTQSEIAELACSYASLILYDDGQQITGDKINTLISNAGVQVQSYWAKLFAKAVEGQQISTFFQFGGASASVAPQVISGTITKTVEQKPNPKKQQKKPQAPQEEDVGMCDLFD